MGGCVVLCVFVAGGGLRCGGDAEGWRRGGAETRGAETQRRRDAEG